MDGDGQGDNCRPRFSIFSRWMKDGDAVSQKWKCMCRLVAYKSGGDGALIREAYRVAQLGCDEAGVHHSYISSGGIAFRAQPC